MKKIEKIIVPFSLGSNSDISKYCNKDYEGVTGNTIFINVEKDVEQEEIENLNNLDSVVAVNEKIALNTNFAITSKAFPLVIGGDHSITLGTISGVSASLREVGLLWIDANGALNSSKTSKSGNIHGMVLAALLGIGDKRLVNMFSAHKKIKTQHVVIFGVRNLDLEEEELIKDINVKYISMQRIKEEGLETVLAEVNKFLGRKISYLHVSIDLDALDPSIAPGVFIPVKNGLSEDDINTTLEYAFANFDVCSADIVEYNPERDIKNRTRELVVRLSNKISDLASLKD